MRRTYDWLFTLLLCVFLSLTACDRVRQPFAVSRYDIRGKLVFSELYYAGSIKTNNDGNITTRDPDDDFAEIRNLSDDVINLRGMILAYGGHRKTLEQDAPLLPGACFIIARKTNGMLLCADWMIDDFTLASNEIVLSLFEGNGRDALDSVYLSTNEISRSFTRVPASILRNFDHFGAEAGSDPQSWRLYDQQKSRGIREGYAVMASPGFGD